MAAFRYRVVSPRGLIAGFRRQVDAESFAQSKSAADGCFVTLRDYPHGSGEAGSVEIAAYLRGEKVKVSG